MSTLRAAAYTLAPDPNTTIQPTVRPRKISMVLSTVAPMDSPTITMVPVAPWDVAALVRDLEWSHLAIFYNDPSQVLLATQAPAHLSLLHHHHVIMTWATPPSTTRRRATRSLKPNAIAIMDHAETTVVSSRNQLKEALNGHTFLT